MTSALSRRTAWLVVVCVVLANFVSFLDRQTLAVLAPTVRAQLGISRSSYGWLFSVFYAGYLGAAPLAGYLLDRAGARRGLLFSVPVWSLVSALHAFVPGFRALLAARFSLAVAESPATPGCVQAITRVLPPAERARGLGMLFIGSSAGAALSAVISTAIAGSWGWQRAFLGTAAIGLVWVPLWLAIAWRPAVREVLDRRVEIDGPHRRGSLLAMLRQPAVTRGVIVYVLVAPAVVFSGVWSSEMLVTDQGVDANDVGHYLWLPPLAIDFGALLFGDLLARRAARRDGWPDRTLLAIALAFLAAGALACAAAWTPWLATLALAMMMFGAGATTTIMLAETSARALGAVSLVSGILVSAQALTFIVANPIVGHVAEQMHTYSAVLVAIAGFAIAAGVVWLTANRAMGRAASST